MTQAVWMFENGYHDLLSVIPVNAQLSPGSTIASNQLGKVPGRKLANGTWAGYNWRAHEPTIDDVKTWVQQGASIGLRATRVLGLDIDSLTPHVAAEVERIALEVLGPAPVRVGRAPKRLLMYRLAEGAEHVTRMRLFLDAGDGVTHLIELLGHGQQFLVEGTHPGTLRPYEWVTPVPPRDQLTPVTREDMERLFAAITVAFDAMGYRVTREGSGRRQERPAVAQTGLLAPSIDVLREAVALVPNTNDLFDTRESYIKMGYAIRAACGDEVDAGFDIFAAWASRWAEGVNEPDTVRADWRRMRPPYSIGWTYLAELARGYGYFDAVDDFPAEGTAPAPPAPAPKSTQLSERWLADRVLRELGDILRFVPQQGRWLVWDGKRWCPDEKLQAQHAISRQLAEIAGEVRLAAQTPRDQKVADTEARRIESAFVLGQVMKLVRAEPSIALTGSALDADPWLLNTPSGVIDLRTGALSLPRPELLATKLTRTGPDYGGAAPEWRRFLAEATNNDAELEGFLQRLAGYGLTGSTSEQTLTFIFGPGGNGKSVFLNAIREVMGDYAAVAAMDTFTASHFDKHTTDLADLLGARLVTANETQAGRRWDEQRVKQLSGGEPIKARFMRQDNFTYLPSFKLIFSGNHKPEVRDLDPAMRRRMHIVPFTVTPSKVDRELGTKLRSEYPAILAWMVEGAKQWLRDGLRPPPAVLAATEEYFEEEDPFARWAEEETTEAPGTVTPVMVLFEAWREWCGQTGEYAGTVKRFAHTMTRHGWVRAHDADTRRAVVMGIALRPENVRVTL